MNIPQIFLDCCSKSSPFRIRMHVPFIHGDYVYATNGHIACRAKLAEIDWASLVPPQDQEQPPPPAFSVFSHAQKEPEPPTSMPLPDVGEPVRTQCRKCDGAGRVFTCDKCGGAGEHECSCGDSHECAECDGQGTSTDDSDIGEKSECINCEGKGYNEEDKGIAVGGCWLGEQYIRLMRRHGVTEVSVREKMVSPVLFRVGNVEGLLMKRRAPEPGETGYFVPIGKIEIEIVR